MGAVEVGGRTRSARATTLRPPRGRCLTLGINAMPRSVPRHNSAGWWRARTAFTPAVGRRRDQRRFGDMYSREVPQNVQ